MSDTIMIHAQNGATFKVSQMSNWEDTYVLDIETSNNGVGFFLTKAQVSELAFKLDTFTRSLDEQVCETCQGTGTLAVWDGVSAYSGDDACPTCQPELAQ